MVTADAAVCSRREESRKNEGDRVCEGGQERCRFVAERQEAEEEMGPGRGETRPGLRRRRRRGGGRGGPKPW